MEKNQSLDSKNNIKTLHEASFAKRLLAVLMDAVVAAFIMLGFISLVFTPIADKAFHYSEKMATGVRLQLATKLYIYFDEDDDGNLTIYDLKDLTKASSEADYIGLTEYEVDDVDFYKNRLKYYYLNYKTGIDIEVPENGVAEDYRAPNYLDKIDDKLPSELYTEAWFNENFGSITSVEEIRTKVLDATKDFYFQPYFTKLNQELKNIQLFLIMPPFVLSFSIFFIIVPLCFKNGETFGKKVLNIGFVTKDGFIIQKRQIVFRQLILLIYVFLCSFTIGIGVTSIATLGVGVFAYFLATFISKTKRSPLDKLSYLYLVDTNKSVFFSNQFEENQKQKELNEKLNEYHERTPDMRHVIQVGGEVVDEKVKQELQEEKSKHSEKK